MKYFKWRKLRKEGKHTIKSAIGMVNMQRDIMPFKDVEEINRKIAELENALREASNMELVKKLIKEIEVLTKNKRLHKNHAMFEFVEIVVVALSVAMAFRAYFFQPFKIPTGSMQPTLYGIHSVTKEKSFMDQPGLNLIKLAVAGARHKVVKSKFPGYLERLGPSKKPGYNRWRVGSQVFDIPTDVHIQPGQEVHAGQTIWEGDVYTGDHVFVNKMIWNFTKPKRGQIMVFNTTGIKGLTQGIFYIKRMVGLPNEEISIDPPYLMVNGQRVENCFGIEREEAGEGLYAGYQLPVLPRTAAEQQAFMSQYPDVLAPQHAIVTGDDEYVAMGDNTMNSFDSRYWGTVPLENLVGTQFLVYWPISKRWGFTR